MDNQTNAPDWEAIRAKLAEPFPAEDIEWRVQSAGFRKDDGTPWVMVLAYVTNRGVQTRFDDAVGIGNWSDEYRAGPLGGIMCGITVHGVTKWDGADNTAVEAIKGGFSDAEKRAAVKWGVGRYLYKLDATFANCSTSRQHGGWKAHYDKKTEKKVWWQIPSLPNWALPAGEKPTYNPKKPIKERPAKANPATPLPTKASLKAEIEKCTNSDQIGPVYRKLKNAAEQAGLINDLVEMCAFHKDNLAALEGESIKEAD